MRLARALRTRPSLSAFAARATYSSSLTVYKEQTSVAMPVDIATLADATTIVPVERSVGNLTHARNDQHRDVLVLARQRGMNAAGERPSCWLGVAE